MKKGFTAIEVVLAVVVLAIIGFVVWSVVSDDEVTENDATLNQETPETGDGEDEVSEEPATQVTVDGFNASVTIAPSVDNVLSGTVTVTLEDAPDGTNLAFFTIAGPGISEEGPNLGIDSDSSGGWSRIVDTTEYENGVYDIGALAMPSADDNPLGTATAQVVIEN